MEALGNGKDVYLEKPMTYTVDEAKEIAETVKASGRVLQVGSQYTSMDHFWKAKKAIADGLLGEVVWASGGFGRNRNQRGEWNYAIDADATEKTLDWKAFLGPAAEATVRSGALLPLAQVLGLLRRHRHRPLLPHGVAAAAGHRRRVPAPRHRVGRHLPAEGSRGAGHVLHERRLPGLDDAAGVFGRERRRRAAGDPRQPGHAVRRRRTARAFNNTQMEVVPDREYRDEFVKKTGGEVLKIDVQAVRRAAAHPHMDNFLDCVRSRQEPNLPARARLPGDGGDWHGRAGLPPERSAVLRSAPRAGQQQGQRRRTVT